MTNETNLDAAPQHPLANDANGNPLDVPPEAVAWRVRKLARRAGRPKVIFDAETGRPLELPHAVTYDDFVEQVNDSGRFRLEAVDGNGRIIPGCVAVTEVVLDDEDDEQMMPRNAAEALPHLHQLIAQLVDANTQVMKAMASAFGNVQPQHLHLGSMGAPSVSPGGDGSKAVDAIERIGATITNVVGTVAAHRNAMMAAVGAQAPSPKAG